MSEPDPYCLPDEKGYIHCRHCREVEQARLAGLPRIEADEAGYMRDLTPSEESRIRSIAAEVFAIQAKQRELLDEAFRIIGLESFEDACGTLQENYMAWLWPEEETPEAFADGFLDWAQGFQESFNGINQPKPERPAE